MADVIEVIHKINYEVNDADLNRVTDVIRLQISEINRLTGVLRNYQSQLNSTKEVGALSELSRSIDRVAKQIEGTIKQTEGSLSGFRESMRDSFIDSGVSSFLDTVKEGLKNVKNEGGGAGGAIAAVGKNLFSLSGALPLVISLVGAFASKLFEAGETARIAEEKHRTYLESIHDTIAGTQSNIISRTNELRQLFDIIRSNGPGVAGAIQKVRDEFGGILSDINDKELINGKGLDIIEQKIFSAERYAGALQVNKANREQLDFVRSQIAQKKSGIEFAQSRIIPEIEEDDRLFENAGQRARIKTLNTELSTLLGD